MKALAPHVKNAIHNAPEFNNAWLQQSLERFNNVYNNDKLEPEHYKQQPQKRMTTPRLSI